MINSNTYIIICVRSEWFDEEKRMIWDEFLFSSSTSCQLYTLSHIQKDIIEWNEQINKSTSKNTNPLSAYVISIFMCTIFFFISINVSHSLYLFFGLQIKNARANQHFKLYTEIIYSIIARQKIRSKHFGITVKIGNWYLFLGFCSNW